VTEIFVLEIAFVAYLAIGYHVYRARWPDGLWAAEDDDTLERIRRVGRKRVLPLPARQRNRGHHPPAGRR
jgi:hypothetical protein